ncbi:PREDICTED: uncharacterized protein LOC109487444 [Branchiostoma belcheri]|uniref:Uncharacterized protein LOC109487444 n=1 Tax=Branchiostoma belcheri TaxID=7741 RepID=A0A6P5ABI3_BRABE|nr:PREDICTED: uncharacterized protein LOC109487444 [Branchiostoma belcheri]
MSHTELSAVVDGFRELDLIFQSGSDLDVVERGYARKLVHAISSQNVVIECEALKGLGDLYLHKAKKNHGKVENFHKACSLYTELLRYYTSREEKQVVQHRIRYAEKCTKLSHYEETAKSSATNSGNTLLAVSMTLHEVKTKVKGYGTVTLIEGYTDTLVKAIVERNKRLQIESLKSLGDVYLEKGRVGKDETAFTESAGLYRAALDRCEDSDDRETLLHRIKYTEKVKGKEYKKAVKRLDRGLLWNKKIENSSEEAQKVTDSEYKDHIQKGCKAMQTGGLDTAERHFAAALKVVHLNVSNADQRWKETEALCKLSDVYLSRGEQSKDGGDFTKAAALSNAALVRSKAEDRDGIEQTIQEITHSFVKHVLSIEQMVPIDDVEKHKAMLVECRGYVEEELKRIEQQIDPYSLDDNDPKIREVEEKRVDANKDLFDTIVHQRRTFIAGLVDECIEVMGPPPCKYAMIGLGSQAIGLVTPYSDLEFAILIEKELETNVEYFSNLTHYLHLKVINLGETILPAMAIKSLNDFESDNELDNWFYDSATPRGFSFDGAMPHACKTPLGRASSLNNLGAAWRDLGDYRKAVSYYEQALEMNQSIFGESVAHPDIANSLNNLGVTWCDLGNYRNGISSFEQSLQMKHNMYGKGVAHPDIAESLSNLGIAWSDLGDYRKAVNYHEQSLQMRQSIFGKGIVHPEIIGSLNNLGTVLSHLGDHRKAISYFEQSLQMTRSVYGEGIAHPKIASSLNNLGFAWGKLGDYRKAISYHEQSLQMRWSICGESVTHPDIALSLNNMGSSWGNLGDHRKAISYFEQSLQTERSIYGERTAHPDIAQSLHNLYVAWSVLGDRRKAAFYYDQWTRMKQKIDTTYEP